MLMDLNPSLSKPVICQFNSPDQVEWLLSKLKDLTVTGDEAAMMVNCLQSLRGASYTTEVVDNIKKSLQEEAAAKVSEAPKVPTGVAPIQTRSLQAETDGEPARVSKVEPPKVAGRRKV